MISYMKGDGKLSGVLHVLLHMGEVDGPVTSDMLARVMHTNPVVIRRVLAGLRKRGYVTSEKGHGGGWQLSCDLNAVTLHDIYVALGDPTLLAICNRTESPECLVEQAVNSVMSQAFHDAEALLLARFREVTLAALSRQIHHRQQDRAFCRVPGDTRADLSGQNTPEHDAVKVAAKRNRQPRRRI